ncbi:MAG: DUF1929 domain-containing protein [Planctomycetes bacterium]|nr:DUF1929 domain-containing protein [Planctomycetota bacterium]
MSLLLFLGGGAPAQNPCAPPATCPPPTLAPNVGGLWSTPITDVVPTVTPPGACGAGGFSGEIAHAILMPPDFPTGAHPYTGMVFFITLGACPNAAVRVWVWDPANPAAPATPICPGNLANQDFFCSGHSFAPNGDLIIAGGTDSGGANCNEIWGHRAIWRFKAGAGAWELLGLMAHERWYTTTMGLPNGNILIAGHTEHPTAVDLGLPYDPRNTYEILTTSPGYSLGPETLVCDPAGIAASPSACTSGGSSPVAIEDYGWLMVTRLGQILYAGPKSFQGAPGQRWKRYGNFCASGCSLPPAPASQYWPRDSQPVDQTLPHRSYGNPVHMFFWDQGAGQHREEVYLIGGDSGFPQEASCSSNTQATVEAIINPAPGVAFIPRAPMTFSRRFANAVPTPTGKIIVRRREGPSGSSCVPRSVPEMYDPIANTWQPLNPQCHARGYHSVAFTRLDGMVVSAGGLPYSCWCPGSPSACPSPEPPGPSQPVTCNCNPLEVCPPVCAPLDMTAQHSVEILEPPFLLTAAGSPAPRPTITFSPTDVQHYSAASTSFGVNVRLASPTDDITMVSLLRPPSVTHHQDFDQRFVELYLESSTGTGTSRTLKIRKPENANICPPGWYILFTVAASGVPSVGAWLNIHP